MNVERHAEKVPTPSLRRSCSDVGPCPPTAVASSKLSQLGGGASERSSVRSGEARRRLRRFRRAGRRCRRVGVVAAEADGAGRGGGLGGGVGRRGSW